MRPPLLSILTIVACAASLHAVNAVTTCGGLVSIPPHLNRLAPAEIDFTHISLSLTTQSGLRKENVKCLQNGLYIVPIWESGDYILEPKHPQHWSFSPAQYEFSVSADGQCDADFNFHIQGFPLIGSVSIPRLDSCSDQHSKASHVLLTAQSASDSSSDPITTYTNGQGLFTIPGLTPGNYIITAQHPKHQIVPDSINHTVSWGESRLPPFRMVGATVSGLVAVPSKIGMGLYLLPRSKPLSSCIDRQASCYCKVSDTGAFQFKDVACGSYTLYVDIPASTARYSMNINSLDIEVGVDDIVIAPNTFAIVGVTVVGKVIHGKTQQGIDKGTVFVDGAEVAVTDANGEFFWNVNKIDHSGPYNLKVFKRGHHFSDIPPYYIGGPAPSITTEKYNVCGFVQVADSNSSSDYLIEVIDDKSSVIESLELDDDGAYCFAADPGQYMFRPVSALGLLSPPARDISVIDSPVDNVNFYQLTVAANVFVTCFQQSACNGVNVSIENIDRQMVFSNVTSADGSTLFSELTPCSYRLYAAKSNICFETINVEISSSDVSDVHIKQKGINIDIKSPIHTQMDLIDTVKHSSIPVTINAGSSSLCIPSNSPHLYILQSSTSSPVRFKNEPITISDFIDLQLDKVLISGEIVIPVKLASSLNIEAVSDHETLQTTATVVGTDHDLATLQYKFWGHLSTTYTITITDSADLVFEPNQLQVTASIQDNTSLPLQVQLVRGQAGLFRSGRISPSVPGAKAIARSSGSGKSLEMTVLNDGYRFGPLSDAADYTIEIQHPDYNFEPIGNGDFRSVKLRSVQVKITDVTTGAPIQGVLVSLTASNYRNSTLSDINGKANFSGLVPGQYYLFVVLKEFVFRPHSQMIDLTADDAQADFTISAERTLYSVFGSLKTVSQNSISNVVITAAATDSDHLEETVSDASGNYRIRGLSAGATYKLTLRSLEASNSIERSVPAERIISMPKEDVMGVDFICYRPIRHGDIFGTLPPGTMPTFVELRHKETGDLEKSISCSPAKRFFTFSNVPFGSYVISAFTKDLSLESIPVDVSGPVKIAIESHPLPKENLHNDQKSSIFTILLGFGLIFAVVNYESLQTSIKKWNVRRRSKMVSVDESWNANSFRKHKNSPAQKPKL